ncbi:MAG: NAD(P)-dependent oxidoreductase [Dehalococcoidia bacterium]
MEANLPDKINVMIAMRVDEAYKARVRAVAPGRIEVFDAWGDLIPEMREEWPERMMARNASEPVEITRTPEEREAMIAAADVVLCGVPFPRHLPHRATNLKWAHFTFAGTSNLGRRGQWWNTPFAVTSSRGYTGARPIAESVVAAAMMFARRLDLAAVNSNPDFDAKVQPPVLSIEGKTIGIIGLGGIGAFVAQMCKGLGMRVVATRRSATEVQQDVDGVDVLYPVEKTHDMLAESDFIAVCAMWTPETQGMFNEAAFDACKPGAFFLNVARGELVEDAALIAALKSGRLAGAYLDVWPNDFATLPDPELLANPNVVITPHISGQADTSHNFGAEVFLDNLQRFVNGEPLLNQIDFERGY